MHTDSSRSVLIALTLIVAIGMLLRLDLVLASRAVIDSDEAIVGLMAKHILERGEIPVFYYGQHYMGSLEPLVASLFFKIGGTSSLVLKLVPLMFSLALIVCVYQIGKALEGIRTGLLAALLCAVAPNALLVWSSMARGGFIEIVLIGAMALLQTIYWLRAPNLFRTVLIGMLLGFGWWVNNQIIFFMCPIGAVMAMHLLGDRNRRAIVRVRAAVTHFFSGVLAWLFGGLPFWIYNLSHNFVSFEMFHPASEGRYLDHFWGLVTVALPMLLGAKRFWESQDLFPAASLLYGGVYGVLLLLFLYYRSREIRDLLLGRLDTAQPLALLLLFLLATGVIFALSSFGWLYHAPRYLLPIYVAIFVLTAWTLVQFARSFPLAGATLAVLVIGLQLASSYIIGRVIPGEPFVFKNQRVAKNHDELIAWLDEKGYDWVRTNYWIGYRLAFETNERVRFVMFQAPHQVRIKEYQRMGALKGADTLPMVLVPAQARLVTDALTQLGYLYEVETRSGYQIVHNIRPLNRHLVPIAPGLAQARASHHPESAAAAVDGDEDTRWGSGAPQSPDMRFELDLPDPITVGKLEYLLSDWWHDFPRVLRVELETVSGEHVLVLDDERSRALRYYLADNAYFSLYFAPRTVKKVLLYQRGADPIYDWSIAELKLYQVPVP